MNLAGIHTQVQGMVSAYLDDELTQSEAQRVRIHLEDCLECARAFGEMSRLRNMTAALPFPDPPWERLDEVEQRLSVRTPRQTGWVLICTGVMVWLGWMTVQALRHMRMPTAEEALSGLIVAGVVLLFVSVVLQRWLEYPNDRYRRVKR